MFVDDICTSENTRRFSTGGSPVGHYTVPLKSYDLNFNTIVLCPSDVCNPQLGAVQATVRSRCTVDVTPIILTVSSMTLQNAVRALCN